MVKGATERLTLRRRQSVSLSPHLSVNLSTFFDVSFYMGVVAASALQRAMFTPSDVTATSILLKLQVMLTIFFLTLHYILQPK